MAFAEDRSQFFDTRDFGVVATFTRGGVAVATANVIFDDPSHEVTVYETQVEEAAHTLLADAPTVAAVKRGDAVSVEGGAYTVERIEPDGNGLKLMYLAQA
jgi:hypothetical protein